MVREEPSPLQEEVRGGPDGRGPSTPRRKASKMQVAKSQYLKNRPWIAGFWLSGIIAATILSIVPGNWISVVQHVLGFSPAVGHVIEELLHFLGYAVLVGTISLICRTRAKLVLVYIIALSLAVLTELLQVFVPDRGVSLEDLAMNVLGASVGILVGLEWLRRLRSRERVSNTKG